jgi:hypothetical protein
MDNRQKAIVVTLLIVAVGGYAWGWTMRPHLRYELLPQTSYDFCGFGPPPPPLTVLVSVDNVGSTMLVAEVTLSTINATISTSQQGPFGTSATALLRIRPKDSFALWFYVIPNNRTNSFRVSLGSIQSAYGLDPLSDLVYFLYSTSIYQPLNIQPLTYVGSDCNFNLQHS